MKRASGILLPVFSLSSNYGIGTFGKEAQSFILFLEKAHQSYWQMLPLNPTSYGDSPYQSFSAFALNPYFIDLDLLADDKLLTKTDLKTQNQNYEQWIDYGKIYHERFLILRKAYSKAIKNNYKNRLDKFVEEQKEWLKDYAIFMVLKNQQNGKSWQEWSKELRIYDSEKIDALISQNTEEYYFWVFLQYEAFKQYKDLRKFACEHGVKIIGDIPIYVALDSADVWANSSMFQLDEERRPTKVAGVPPDYFSATGQLWGNPLYDYDKMEKDNYSWWKYRVKKCSELFDVLRIDHFRGIDE